MEELFMGRYLGNGTYIADEKEYEKMCRDYEKNWSPSYNPNPFGTVDLNRKNEETFRHNNGQWHPAYLAGRR